VTEIDFSDVFADGVSIAGGPFGIALTFHLSDPSAQGDREGVRMVARVRITSELARVLGDALTQAATRAEPQVASAG